MLEFAKIACFGTFAAIGYGILHDQITAHVCVEYFTIAHPLIFPTKSPFWLAVGWGIVATWWVGLPFGIGLAFACRLGQRSRLSLSQLKTPIIRLMAISGIIAILSGLTGVALVLSGFSWAIGDWSRILSPGKWPYFAFDLWAHSASYFAGAFGGTFLVGRIVVIRRRMLSTG